MRAIVVDHVCGFRHRGAQSLDAARIQVAIEAREVAAEDLEAQPVPGKKDIARPH